MTGLGPQPNSPYPPPWTPVAGPTYMHVTPPPSRGPVIIAAAIITAAMIVAGVLFATRDSGGSSPAGPAAGSASSTASTPTLVQMVPATLLPTADQVRQATLIDVKYTGDVSTKVLADAVTTPPKCALANDTTTQSAWAAAISTAYQQFGDGPTYAKSINFGAVSVAIFDTPTAAADSLAKVSDSVHGCTGFTVPDRPGGALAWTVGDVASQDDRITWTDTEGGVNTQWKCSKSYRLLANAVAFSTVCASNPGDGPVKLTDQIVANATKHQ
ncbi:sensor domain-containing protein [Mycolicibacterium sphagni]|uniref:Sensor domain-containing protein n=1 Tax=Mycolicibacterium sphagni TaxID=1786 RepID=A0ABX2K4G4_9MYCO|nr:sensor domain-containing protein [Mycolicibacterium sphagni]NTY62600.1 sensor domain-containing protein [Mycolicibacterium sphagni]